MLQSAIDLYKNISKYLQTIGKIILNALYNTLANFKITEISSYIPK